MLSLLPGNITRFTQPLEPNSCLGHQLSLGTRRDSLTEQ